MYCLCVNVYCHRVTTQLQLTNISYHKHSTAFVMVLKLPTDMRLHLKLPRQKEPRKIAEETCGCARTAGPGQHLAQLHDSYMMMMEMCLPFLFIIGRGGRVLCVSTKIFDTFSYVT